MLDIHIRWMILRDLPEMVAIESESYPNPWSEEDFMRYRRQRNCIGRVAEFDEQVVGFMIYELHKTRLHVLNFTVAKKFSRRGIGTQMMDDLAGRLSHERRNRMTLMVREGNLDAQLFFRAMGFEAIEILRNQYGDSDEDAYLMQYTHEVSEWMRTKQIS